MSSVNKETIDRLTPWLLSNLHSEDLDAKDMADYVVSLISAPGTQEQLFERCCKELEEFLGPQTEQFVNALFQQIQQLTQPPQPAETAEPAQIQPDNAADSSTRPLSGGQEEFRRNFRGNFSPFPSVQGQSQPPFQSQPAQPAPFQPPQGPQGFQMPQFPGFPGFPQMPGMPPQFQGFPGFNNGRPNSRGPNNRQYNNNPRQRKVHSQLSSIQNEHSVANRRLVIEQIPPEHLNKQSVENYFGRFGKITNVKVIENQQLAEVEFEGHDQAVEAHKCPDPIFGNRFVKVFWRKHQPEEEPELDVEAVRRMQAVKQQQFEEREARRKELTANLRAVMSEQAAILQQRQQILQSGQSTPEIQAEMQQKSDELSVKLKSLKQELTVLQGGNAIGGSGSAPGPFRGGSFRGRGGNPYARGGARGGYRGGSHSAGLYSGGANRFQNASLDRRPKAVLLEGVAADKDEVLRGELASRNYTDFQRKSDSSVLIEFADRRAAEEFYGAEVPELGEFKKTWTRTEPKPEPQPQPQPQPTPQDTSMDES